MANYCLYAGSDPTPCKPIAARSSYERERLRETHERQLLNQAGYNQQVRQPAAVTRHQAQPATGQTTSVPVAGQQQAITNQMQQMALDQNGAKDDDGWTTVPKKGTFDLYSHIELVPCISDATWLDVSSV